MSRSTVAVKFTGEAADLQRAIAKINGDMAGLGSLAKTVLGAGIAGAAVGAVAGLGKIGETFDEQFDKIRVATGSTGDQLKSLEGSFKQVVSSVPTDFDSAGSAIGSLNQRLGLTGQPLANLSKQFLELSRITKTDVKANLDAGTGALNQWGITAKNQPKFMDEIFRVSQKTGVSFQSLTTDLGANGPVLKAAGLSWGQSAALLGTLGKNGLAAADVMPSLSKALATAGKHGKDAGQLIGATFDRIKNAPNDVQASGDAIAVFGAKAGPKLAELIRSGKLGYDDLLKSIQGGGDTIMGASKDTQDFGEKWTVIKNRILVGLEPLATKVFDAVGKAMDAVGPALDRMQTGFQVMKQWVDAHWPKIQAVVQTVLGAVQGIIEGFVSVATTLWNNFGDNILSFAQRVWGPLQQTIQGALDIIRGIIQTVTSLIQGDWSGVWDGIKQIFSGAWQVIQGSVKTAFEELRLVVGAALEVVGSVVKGAWDGIIGFIGGLGGRITSAAAGIFDGIKSAFKAAINFVINGWNGLEFKLPTVDTHIPGIGKVGGFTIGTEPKIHPLASGGIVKARPGGTLALIGEGGHDEAVVPLGRGGFGGNTINLNVTANVNSNDPATVARELVEHIRRELLRTGRRNGSIFGAFA